RFVEVNQQAMPLKRLKGRDDPASVAQMVDRTVKTVTFLENFGNRILQAVCKPIHLLFERCSFGHRLETLRTHDSTIEIRRDLAITSFGDFHFDKTCRVLLQVQIVCPCPEHRRHAIGEFMANILRFNAAVPPVEFLNGGKIARLRLCSWSQRFKVEFIEQEVRPVPLIARSSLDGEPEEIGMVFPVSPVKRQKYAS